MKMRGLLQFAFGIALVLSFTTSLWAYSPRETKRAYQGCLAYLKMPVGKQKAIARQIDRPWSMVVQQCRYLKRIGLAEAIRLEREYQRAGRSGGGDDDSGWGRPQEEPTPAPTPVYTPVNPNPRIPEVVSCSGGICTRDDGTQISCPDNNCR